MRSLRRVRGPRAAAPAAGEIVLEHATRTFSVRADQARTLRGMLKRERVEGPPPVPALQDVSLRIAPGETVGMVGRNGAGKTSTLKVLAGIVPLQSGQARCGGRIVSLLELAAGFSRDFSGRENIFLQGALFGFHRAQIEARLEQIVAFSELGDFLALPVRTYSQGMLLRLGFSIAAHLDADVLLIDEVLAVGDEAFQRRCLRRISEQIAGGATLLLVSHELASIERVCERVIVLDHGHVAFDGPTTDGLARYRELMGVEHDGGRSLRPSRETALEVVDLELRDGAGHVASVFSAFAPLAVQIGLRAAGEVRDPSVRLELRAGTALLFASDAAVELGSDGRGALSFEIGELSLLAGDYEIAVGAGEGSGPPTHPLTAQRSVSFAVSGASGAQGLIDLRGAWCSPAGAERVR